MGLVDGLSWRRRLTQGKKLFYITRITGESSLTPFRADGHLMAKLLDDDHVTVSLMTNFKHDQKKETTEVLKNTFY